MKIQITEVQIEFVTPHEGLIAFATVVINNCMKFSSVAIHKKLNSEGYRITYPSKGKFNVFHPINKQTSETIEEAIFSKLKNVIKERSNNDVYDRHNESSNSI